MKRALFLDRDGVINRMIKYNYGWDSPQKPDDVKLVNDIEKIILWANEHKIPVIEVTNQPSVAKGKMNQETSDAIKKKVHQLLKEKKVFIDKTYICPHHPNAVIPKFRKTCNCRKPKPGLLLKAANELGIDLEKSIMLGDKASDIEAGKSAGCKTIIFIHNEDTKNKTNKAKLAKADYKVLKISEAIPIIKNFLD